MFSLIRGGATWFIAAFAVAAAVVCSSGSAAAYPPAGTDEFDSAATVTINLGMPMAETATGPTKIERGSPFNPGDGRMRIDTEIVSMELHGRSSLGPIAIVESPTKHSSGYVQQKTAGVDFPADSFFDVYILIDSPLGMLHNNAPITMIAEINAIPPLQATYKPPVVIGVPLFNDAEVQVGVITHAEHFVSEKPSFSVAPGGPSNLSAADIFDVPTVSRIPAANLGLVAGDDLDGLSYGLDWIHGDVAFSVAPGAAGIPPSDVATEAAKVPSEAHGDEFVVYPPLPTGGSNVQALDENGNTAPAFPLQISDDVDALTEEPTSFVDTDGNTVPDAGKPVYFSLTPGSPTLGTIGATPADILVNVVPPAAPVVFITQAALGLAPGDDIEDFCLDDATSTVLFSLAPGSPTLGPLGASPSDLFLVRAPIAPPPAVFASAASLGLLTTDNLNALKCMWPVPRPVGGIAESPDTAQPLETGGPSGENYTLYIAGAAAGAIVIIAAGAWYARRRWAR